MGLTILFQVFNVGCPRVLLFSEHLQYISVTINFWMKPSFIIFKHCWQLLIMEKACYMLYIYIGIVGAGQGLGCSTPMVGLVLAICGFQNK